MGDERVVSADDGLEVIDSYLDDLADRLPGRGRNVRQVLAEVEGHLVDAAEAGVREGLAPGAAATRAVARFGPADAVARRFTRSSWVLPRSVLAQGFSSLVLVGAIGLLAVGLSGLLAWAGASAFGKSFVAGDLPGVTYGASRCADFREYHPEAQTCSQAAVAHHFDEVVWARVEIGILGAVVLAGWFLARWWVRRRRARRGEESPESRLPAGFPATVGAALFGMAALVTLPGGLIELTVTGLSHGSGNLLSAGIVSMLAFAGFAVMLWRTLSAEVV